MRIKEALKYGTKEDLITSAVNSGKRDPVALLVAADAHEEAGKEGIADLLRAAAKGGEAYPPEFTAHPSTDWPVISTRTVGSGVSAVFSRLLDSDTRENKGVGLSLALEDKWTPEGLRDQWWRVALTPKEAKEVTARLPNASEIHQHIDRHFPEAPSA